MGSTDGVSEFSKTAEIGLQCLVFMYWHVDSVCYRIFPSLRLFLYLFIRRARDLHRPNFAARFGRPVRAVLCAALPVGRKEGLSNLLGWLLGHCRIVARIEPVLCVVSYILHQLTQRIVTRCFAKSPKFIRLRLDGYSLPKSRMLKAGIYRNFK